MVFILATLLGFASHAPGSLGVFDAAMLVALPQFGQEELVATLVMFRILYFMIPFAIVDHHHGHPRTLAQRRRAMAAAPQPMIAASARADDDPAPVVVATAAEAPVTGLNARRHADATR